jgi:hypothetical protein
LDGGLPGRRFYFAPMAKRASASGQVQTSRIVIGTKRPRTRTFIGAYGIILQVQFADARLDDNSPIKKGVIQGGCNETP